MPTKVLTILITILTFSLTGCGGTTRALIEPYGGTPTELGSESNSPIIAETTSSADAEDARHALKVMGTKQRAAEPQPYKPVRTDAIVRLMWVPDHVNSLGDLVPAHYYYLKVKDGGWNHQDAFDFYNELNSRGGRNIGGATPWVYR